LQMYAAGSAPGWKCTSAKMCLRLVRSARGDRLDRCAIGLATNPNSTEYMIFFDPVGTRQPLVDTAILAHAMLRAPIQLWGKLDKRVQANVVASLKLSRYITPWENNWVLFASMVETFMVKLGGEQPNEERLLRGLLLHK
jgi:hypothetical protein